MSKIAIIGGGAAGMMAAAAISETNPNNPEIFLIEKNAILGRKVIISGGGRCNVTTGIKDLSEILKKYPRGAKFLRTAMYSFPPEKVMEWFENHGVPLKTEKDLRVFPKSNNGKDIVATFEKLLTQTTQILLKTSVKSIYKKDKNFILQLSNNQTLEVDKVIITTGGQAYRHTGSSGDGYKLAEDLGHKITELAPSLNAFVVQESWIKKLSGISFKKAKLKIVSNSKYETEGPILFTHKGITGPAVFAISSLAAFKKIGQYSPMSLFIDFLPEIDYGNFRNFLSNNLKQNHKKLFSNTLAQFGPKSFIKAILKNLSISEGKKNFEVSKKDLNRAIEFLKNTKITLTGQSPGEEFVTAGGIDISEVDSKTIQSKICPGLYFAGEILNIDGFTGGFNLQTAWATGHIAGSHV